MWAKSESLTPEKLCSQRQGQKGTAQVGVWVLTVDEINLRIEHSGSLKHWGNDTFVESLEVWVQPSSKA